jgi:AcrR family transcriptional regulator
MAIPVRGGPSRRKRSRTTGAPTRPRRSRRSPEEMQARILEAALGEFSEHGFSGGRVDRISKRARTVDRMLYYYFGNKDRLFRTVLERVYEEMVQAQRSFTVKADDPVAGMRELVAHSWQHYVDHPEMVRLVTTENLHNGRHLKDSSRIRKLSLPLIAASEALLESGRRKGVFRDDVDARDVLLTIMALGFFYVANRHTLGHWIGIDLMAPERRAHWLEHITSVVLEFLRPPAAAAARGPRGVASGP